ncbi:HAMP domain-containing protein [Paenibacillus sp. UNCCL117]|uniref:methyl-accepting chemotaxis protein n=1 Tax=unclassified Paenibacillus TaxID=185978 RepID=UPI000881FCB9|nr:MULTISPECIES: HAMP domain-containing methyl-accepting chemotaxis protein [unclassified Paenibacillus]SDD06333.1 HAMP domain-containing protein [Paenibacillus sp. cl123]SFW31715.1 HAMP domain-containing protein [Paenibacillus sp. UNCCL117]
MDFWYLGRAALDRLRFVHKFMLIGFVAALPVALLLMQQLGGLREDVRVAEIELRGVASLKLGDRLLPDMGRYRADLQSQSLGRESSADMRQTLESGIDEQLGMLLEASRAMDRQPATDETLARAYEQWQALKSAAAGSDTSSALQAGERFEKELLAYAHEVKNRSGLILERQLEMNYTVDSAANQYPYFWSKLNRATLIALEGSSKGRFYKTEMKDELTQLAGELRTYQESMMRNADTAAASGGPSYDGLNAALREQQDALRYYTDQLQNGLLSSVFVTLTPERLLRAHEALSEHAISSYRLHLELLEDKLRERAHSSRFTMAASAAVSVLAVGAAAYLFAALAVGLRKGIAALEQVSQAMSAGDLTVSLKNGSRDEMGRVAAAFELLSNSYRHVVRQSRDAAEGTLAASLGLHTDSEASAAAAAAGAFALQEIASGSELQSRGIRSSLTALKEMAAGTIKIAESTQVVSESAVMTAQLSHKGNSAIGTTDQQLRLVRNNIAGTAETINRLADLSVSIERVVGSISEMAAQTQLLALNASIEAARAGEHGRGFHVVAEEVRKLAGGSSSAAKQIARLASDIKLSCGEAARQIASDLREADKGADYIGETRTLFGNILSSAELVAEQMQEVSAITEQLSAGAGQITAAMEETAGISRQAATRSSQAASTYEEQLQSIRRISESSGELKRSAEELHRLLAAYKV